MQIVTNRDKCRADAHCVLCDHRCHMCSDMEALMVGILLRDKLEHTGMDLHCGTSKGLSYLITIGSVHFINTIQIVSICHWWHVVSNLTGVVDLPRVQVIQERHHKALAQVDLHQGHCHILTALNRGHILQHGQSAAVLHLGRGPLRLWAQNVNAIGRTTQDKRGRWSEMKAGLRRQELGPI